MNIICPKCKLVGDFGEAYGASPAMVATCPRCKAQFTLRSGPQARRFLRTGNVLGIFAVVLAVCAVLVMHDWKLDKNYFLQPGAWQGEMTYLNKQHPFDMVIVKAQDGRLEGYMDWVETSPRYRLAIRGTYVGNHLVFKDYEFLERKGTAGLNDEQDVYIFGNEMTGTAKNGAAEFRALKREATAF